ncbi:MAG: nicotinamide riboside transporter PnuC [Candidatus Borkfalkiaceae bacterium]|nr:nicotinamide riboside transporter PnuC [Christensenellaceae bacterium]
MENTQTKKPFGERIKNLFKSFTLYEKIWFFSIVILAVAFAFIFPETDEPDYNLTLKNFNSEYVNTEKTFNIIDFNGTQGEFVIDGIKIDDKEYALTDYFGYSEYTIDGESPNTLTLKFKSGKSINANNKITFFCYQDSDEGTISLTITNDNNEILYKSTISFDEKETDSYLITQKSFMVSAAWITLLYVLDVILNIACELLISKQSKWNFIVSLGVEVVEILVCVFCAYRFATMATTLFFWIPCDIISFILWNKHPDEQKEELTVVKKLTPIQDVIIIAAIAVWTVGVGYLLTLIEVEGGIFANNVVMKNIACYLDACVSAVGIANGLLILFRYREQWIAWYISAIIETVINIMAGQWILLVLKAGYLTNTTYGYIKWTKYIKNHPADGSKPLDAPAA